LGAQLEQWRSKYPLMTSRGRQPGAAVIERIGKIATPTPSTWRVVLHQMWAAQHIGYENPRT
jgi:acetolactate synthase-1/2/3 large subunit